MREADSTVWEHVPQALLGGSAVLRPACLTPRPASGDHTSMGVCSQCGTPLAAEQPVCAHCGARAAGSCPACGVEVAAEDRFCRSCGTDLAESAPPAAPTGAPSGPDATRTAAPERRLVSVLFVDLVGFTTFSEQRDPEDVREMLSLYFARCRAVIERYGGTVEKFIGDAVMAVWGTPVAQEDDAERAVRAAIALVDAVTAVGREIGHPDLRARGGVLTGTAAVDPGATHEGMVHGDSVNSASRLQSIAEPGSVMVDDVTRRMTEAAIVYRDAGEREVKGRSQPIRAWTPVRIVAGVGGARRAAGLEAPLTGRAKALEAIIMAGERSAEQGRAEVVVVVGEAGSGKSRLVWEYFKYVDGIQDARWWHQGRCPSYGEGVAYWALSEMVRGRAGISEDEDPDAAREKLRLTVERFVREERERRLVLPRLAHLLGLEQRTATDPADLFSGWRLFFERMAETDPVVLVFEDLQWATSGMLDFIDYLLEWSAGLPIFIVCLGRGELESARPDWETTVSLAPLGAQEMYELLFALVPGLPGALTRRIVERSEGVPLYAVEIIRMLLDRGLLVQDGSRYAPTEEIADFEVPETLQALAAARLDGLGTEERWLVQAAAVLGTSFLPDALAAVSERAPADMLVTLDALVEKQVLGRTDDKRVGEQGQYLFLQALLRNVALSTLSRRERKARHLAAARYIEAIDEHNGELAEVHASHLLDAVAIEPDAADADEIRAAARASLAVAARHTGSLALPDAARRYFEKAAALAEDPVERETLLAQAGVAAGRAGDQPAAERMLRQAIETLTVAGEAAEAARAEARLADVLMAENRLEEACALMDAARERVEDPMIEAELAARRANAAQLEGDYERAYAEAEAALAIADPAGMQAVIASAQTTKARALFDRGRLNEVLALSTLGLELALEASLSEQALRAYYNLAFYRVQAGQPRKALDAIQDGLRLARERGDRPWERDLTAQLISLRVYRGEWDAALEEGDALRVQQEDGAERVAWQTRPLILAARGDDAALAGWLRRELPDSEWYEQSLDETVAHATALRAVGRREEAAPLTAEAWQEIETTGRLGSDLAMYLAALVDGLLDDGRGPGLAEGLLAKVAPLPAIRGQMAWLRGALRLQAGDEHAAAASLTDAVELLRPVEQPFALARALLDQGRCLARTGSPLDAERALREASELFAGLAAVPWVAQADAALAELGAETAPDSALAPGRS